jgi:HD-GYP domain-containing protein (c-di-GMP phosphodiesterase class II)
MRLARMALYRSSVDSGALREEGRRWGTLPVICVSIEQVREGMALARPVPHPLRPGAVLLQAGCRLDRRAIGLVRQYSISHLWIRHVDFEDLDRRLNPGVGELRIQLQRRLKALFAATAARPGVVELKHELALISVLIKELSTDTRHAVSAARSMDDDDLAGHSANVAYLSTVLGLWLRDYIFEQRKGASTAADLSNLVTGAALHDIGKLALDRSLQRIHHFEEMKHPSDYQSHADLGYRLLQGRIESTACAAVLHHHQRADGQGFPASPSRQDPKRLVRPSGRGIHVFSRLVAVANTLDGLACAALRDGRPLASALATLQSPEFRPMFDPVVLLAALQCVPPFPIATVVGLSDGRSAVVVKHNADGPCRPVVRVLENGLGADARAKEELDLSRPGTPRITHAGAQPTEKFFYDISPELILDAARATTTPAEIAVSADA